MITVTGRASVTMRDNDPSHVNVTSFDFGDLSRSQLWNVDKGF